MSFITVTYGEKNGSGATLLFTDTDSLVFKIEIDDVYEDFYENKGLILTIILKIREFMIPLIKKWLVK